MYIKVYISLFYKCIVNYITNTTDIELINVHNIQIRALFNINIYHVCLQSRALGSVQE